MLARHFPRRLTTSTASRSSSATCGSPPARARGRRRAPQLRRRLLTEQV